MEILAEFKFVDELGIVIHTQIIKQDDGKIIMESYSIREENDNGKT